MYTKFVNSPILNIKALTIFAYERFPDHSHWHMICLAVGHGGGGGAAQGI